MVPALTTSIWRGGRYVSQGDRDQQLVSKNHCRVSLTHWNMSTCRSHATYYFIAAGCYASLKNYEKAQKLFDNVPELLEKKKIGGKDLPTEVWIKKKREYIRHCDRLWATVYSY